ncbi:MAG: RIP metalloprotease RseP [Parcubacteria group bacterium]|jgi:regulator of sigma E protease
MFVTIIIFGLILGLLIFVHELGHFLTARRNGVTAHEFGFGFPPRIIGIVENPSTKKKKIIFGNQEYYGEKTLYSINAIPLGGFVRIKGENPVDEKDVKNFDKLTEADKEYIRMATDPDSFSVQSIWARFKILVAGVMMNFVLAWVLISIVLMIGAPEPLNDNMGDFSFSPFGIEIFSRHNEDTYDFSHIKEGYVMRTSGGKSVLFGQINFDTAQKIKKITTLSLPTVMIESVQEDSVASATGIKIGDKIVSLCENDVCSTIENSGEFQKFVSSHADQEIIVHILRGKEDISLSMTPKNQNGKGMIGVSLADITIVRYAWYAALWESLMRVISLTIMILSAFGALIVSIFAGGGVHAEIAGPVGIAMMTQQMRDMGLAYLLQFAAILSVNLGIINILPIPALDGGRILFLIIEKIKGKPVNQRIEGIMHSAFFIALLVLMAVITIRDVTKFF